MSEEPIAPSEGNVEPARQLYRDRKEWTDITPIYHSPREEAVIRIAMTEEFIDAFAYLRAVMQSNELSERTFELTTTCIQLNAANYSVWQFRRNILKALAKSQGDLAKNLADEFEFCENTAYDNPKNYQVWHHRRVLVEWKNDAGNELDFTSGLLQEDSKNYHAWQHRQWVVEKFNLYGAKEVEFTLHLLLDDLRNNSAWNYRYFIFSRLSDGFKSSDDLNREITFTLRCIKKIPSNESPWSYLSGILINEGLSTRNDVAELCTDLYQSECRSVHLRSFMVDCLMEKIELKTDSDKNATDALKLLEELKTIDPLRSKYWTYQSFFVHNLLTISA